MSEVVSEGQGHTAVDRLGALASGVCVVHCALCALLPGILGAVGLGTFVGHEAEWGLTAVAVALATVALSMGWRKHRSRRVASMLAAGVTGLLCARLVEEAGSHLAGTAMGVVAGVALALGHLLNIRASRCCQQRCV